MWAILSFMGHYWQWIAVGAIAVLACGVATFLLKNWKPLAMAAAVFVAFLVAQALYAAGYNGKTEEDVAARTKILEGRLATYERLAAADKLRADVDAAEIERLRKLASNTPADKHAALPRAAARRIGDIK